MSDIIRFRQQGLPGRARVRHEGRYGRRKRLREAERKLRLLQDPPSRLQPIGPVVAHQDQRDVHETHAVNHAINVRDTHAVTSVRETEAVTEASLAAREDELKKLEDERQKHAERQEEFEGKMEQHGLGHELVQGSRWPKRLVKAVAAVFETIALATPLQLLGVLDFGTKASRQETIGALLALAMGAGYAVMLTVLADGVGQQLKRQRYRHVLDGDTSDAEAEGWPRPATTIIDDRVIAVAAAALALALFAAAVIREAAIGILAAAGESHVSISWPIFLLLTAAVFAAVAAVAYWWARPISDENERLKAAIQELDPQIDAKRDECFQLAARIEICRTRIETIQSSSQQEQLGQLQLTAAHIHHRRGANPHVYGGVTDPEHVQDVIENPHNHVRPVQVRTLADELRQRIHDIRHHSSDSRQAAEEGA